MILSRWRHLLFDTIRGRMILGVAAVHALMMTLFIADLTARQREMLMDRQTEETRGVSHALALSAAGWIAADDIAGLQELVEAQRRYPELVYAMMTDDHGLVLAHTDRSRVGQYLQDLPARVDDTTLVRTKALVDVVSPALVGGRHVGWARVGVGQQGAAGKLSAMVRSGFLYALAAIVIGSLISWLIGCRITSRLYAVQETIARVRGGDRLARAAIDGSDEAAAVAGEFNTLLDTLDSREGELRESHDRLLTVLNSLDAIVYVADMETYEVLFINQNVKDVFGDITGQLCWQRIQSDQAGPCDFCTNRELLDADGRPKGVCHWEFRNTTNGRWYDIRDRAITWIDGRIVRLEIATDITERKQAEEELQHYREHLEELVRQRTAQLQTTNQELESFSYSVSHDLQAPLRRMAGFSRMLLEDWGDKLDAEAVTCLERIDHASDTMGRLVDALLQFSRLTRAELNLQPVNLSLLAGEIAGELQEGDLERDVRIDIAPGLQATADPVLMRVVLQNLLGNAWKYTRQVSPALIAMTSEEQEGRTVYCIRDNGAGFDMARAHMLFAPFQRLHGSEFEGTGIGLATVQRIIHRHGGEIRAEAAAGEGAVFRFTLGDVNAAEDP